ncbi:hypothetical protein FHR33_003924 [Nonomuraea dietziae]|uniref:Uncharacterized protein n=1 Tax=Nonomuraea dietziae TaxID=65515 RepID=A0A7W5YRT1_9ACTN|nr:hypothetical protein [Nonomuraea dietziae]
MKKTASELGRSVGNVADLVKDLAGRVDGLLISG